MTAAIAVLAGAALSAGAVDAARGGKGGGKGGHTTPPPTTGGATVTLVSANPVPLGTAPTFYVTGFAPGETVLMIMSDYITGDVVTVDSTGSTTYTFWTAMNAARSYTFTAQNSAGTKWGNVTFTVQ